MTRLAFASLVTALVATVALTGGIASAARGDNGHRNTSGNCSSTSAKPASWKREHCSTSTHGSTSLAGQCASPTTRASWKREHCSTTSRSSGTTSNTPTQTMCGPKGVSGLDVHWLKTSAQGDVFEIQGGRMALAKSSNPAVRQLAQTLITDHTKSLEEARKLAAEYGIELQLQPTPEQHWLLDELGQTSGAVFDHEYSEVEALDHVQDIEETTNEVNLGCDTEIRGDAQQEIPVLQKHLELARAAFATTSESAEQNGGTESEPLTSMEPSPSSGATAGRPNACGPHGVSGMDIVWLQTSAQGDIFEIRGGQMALAKSSNPAVRQLAQTLITDHTKSLHDAQQLAQEYGIQLPNDPTPEQQWILGELSQTSGAVFDNEYSEVEVLDHVQDIEETQDEVSLGCDTEIRGDAQQEIPVLQKHLALAHTALAASPETTEPEG